MKEKIFKAGVLLMIVLSMNAVIIPPTVVVAGQAYH